MTYQAEYKKWNFIQVNDDCRLYYSLYGDDEEERQQGRGFAFYGINEKTKKFIFEGWGILDGVRHLHLGEKGYFNYPNLGNLASMIQALENLEKKHCADMFE